VYALGATMYHLFTGRAPATATQRVADPSSFRPPHALGAHISADVERAILRALELQPAKRFDSATTMRTALRQAQRRVTVADATMTRRLPRWSASLSRANWRRFAAPFGAIALLLGVGVIALSGSAVPGGLPPAPGTTATPTGFIASPSSVVSSPTAPAVTASPTHTLTPSPTQSNTPALTTTSTLTSTLTATPTATRTRTRTATPTRTSTPTPTFTSRPSQPTNTPTRTPEPPTPTPTPEPPTPTPTPPRPTTTPPPSATPAQTVETAASPTP